MASAASGVFLFGNVYGSRLTQQVIRLPEEEKLSLFVFSLSGSLTRERNDSPCPLHNQLGRMKSAKHNATPLERELFTGPLGTCSYVHACVGGDELSREGKARMERESS